MNIYDKRTVNANFDFWKKIKKLFKNLIILF
jgi:hypothetical protein